MMKAPESHIVEQIRARLQDDFDQLRAEIERLSKADETTHRQLAMVADDIRAGKRDFQDFREEQRAASAGTQETLRKILDRLTPKQDG